jgi:hypothetical protein
LPLYRAQTEKGNNVDIKKEKWGPEVNHDFGRRGCLVVHLNSAATRKTKAGYLMPISRYATHRAMPFIL